MQFGSFTQRDSHVALQLPLPIVAVPVTFASTPMGTTGVVEPAEASVGAPPASKAGTGTQQSDAPHEMSPSCSRQLSGDTH